MPAVIDASIQPRLARRRPSPRPHRRAAISGWGGVEGYKTRRRRVLAVDAFGRADVPGDLLQADIAAAVLGRAAEAVDAPLPVR